MSTTALPDINVIIVRSKCKWLLSAYHGSKGGPYLDRANAHDCSAARLTSTPHDTSLDYKRFGRLPVAAPYRCKSPQASGR